MHAKDSYHGEVIAERRRFPRFPLKLQVTYRIASQEPVTTSSENIGLGGLAVLSDRPVEVGQRLKLSLYLPRIASDMVAKIACEAKDARPVDFEARVVWSTRFGTRTMFGAEFTQISDPGRELLRKFLEEYEMDQPRLSF